jgi:hypothetical protein
MLAPRELSVEHTDLTEKLGKRVKRGLYSANRNEVGAYVHTSKHTINIEM